MSKNKALKVVNVLLLVLLINQAATGMLAMKLPHEVFEWGHQRAAYVLLTVAAVHTLLNWNWIKASYFKKGKG
jgi:heme A synthase